MTAILLTGLALGQQASAQILWSSASGNAWLVDSNWTGGAVPTGTQVAQFGVNPTAGTGVGINFADTTNAGTQTNGQRIQEVGAIEITSARTAAMIIGNSTATVGATGQFRLNGVTVNGVVNTIIRNNSSQTLTIQDRQGSGEQTMTLLLGNATANVINVDNTGNVVINSSITGVGRSLTLNPTSSGSLRLGGANTFSGGITINGGSGGGRLRFDSVGALPSAGNITVNTGGRLSLNAAGTYGGASQSLTLNPNQTTTPSFDITADLAVTWQGTVIITADTRIEVAGASGGLTLAGAATGSGTLIKQGAGNLILSNLGNNLTGASQVGSGTITVHSGSSLGSGALTMFQTGTNTTAVVFNNAAQSIGTLSSQFTASTGTRTQTITLNGTELTINQTADTTFGAGAVSTLTSRITGTGSLIKQGSATLTLSSDNDYTGTTSINAGTLVVNGNNSAATGALTVASGGTLGGVGAVGSAATVQSGGTIRGDSGNGSGTLNTGNVTVQSGGRLGVQLGTGTEASRLNTSAGILNLNSGAIIDPNGTFGGSGDRVLATLGSGTGKLIVGGTTYDTSGDIATYTYATGDTGLKTFGALQLDVTGLGLNNGEKLVLSRNTSNQLVLNFSPVPEPPSVLALCGLAVGGAVGLRKLWRKRV